MLLGMNKKFVLKNYWLFDSYKTFWFFEGLADNNTSDSKEENKDVSAHSTGLKILVVFVGVLAVIAFGVFLFKLWQRKKREEQHARLLKLFEDDDELEVELGMRD